MRDQFDAHSACKLPGSMGAHAVGDNQQIAGPLPFLAIICQYDRKTILIVSPTHSNVAVGFSAYDRTPVAWLFGR
jgi:hypothetical protein